MHRHHQRRDKEVMDKIIAKHPEYKSYAQAFAGVVERGIRVFEEE